MSDGACQKELDELREKKHALQRRALMVLLRRKLDDDLNASREVIKRTEDMVRALESRLPLSNEISHRNGGLNPE